MNIGGVPTFLLRSGLKNKEVLAMNSGDTVWVLASSALVLVMTVPAIAFFYGGLVRRKNVLSLSAYTVVE